MDFRAIPENDIILFLNQNNIVCNDIYQQAIHLLNQDHVILTTWIKCWLTAYTYQDDVIQTNQSLLYYQKVFDDQTLTIMDVNMILSHYRGQVTALPDEVMFQILLISTELKHVNKTLYQQIKRIQSTEYYQLTACEFVLQTHGYDGQFDRSNVKYIYKTLNPTSGSVLYCTYTLRTPLSFVDEIVKINTFKRMTLFLSKTGKVFSRHHTDYDWQMTDVFLPTQDVCWCKPLGGWLLLSRGKVYFGKFNCYNRFAYQTRLGLLEKSKNFNFTQLYGIDNVLSIQTDKMNLIMLKTNGDLYRYDGKQITCIDNHVRQIAYNKSGHCIIKDENITLVSCYDGHMEINHDSVVTSIGDYYIFDHMIVDGYYHDNHLLVINQHHDLFYEKNWQLVDAGIHHVYKVTIIPISILCYYVIVSPKGASD